MDSIQLPGYATPTPIDSIIWLEGETNYTRIHHQNGAISLVTKPLSYFEQYSSFIRIHRSASVNSMYVQEFARKKGRFGLVHMSNGKPVPVSRAYLAVVNALWGHTAKK